MNDNSQPMDALAKANAIRSRRAQDKRAIYSGQMKAQTLILANPPEWASATVLDVLRAIRRVGETRARKIARVACLDAAKLLGELTERQRVALADAVTAVVDK